MTRFLQSLDQYVRTIDYVLLVTSLVCSGFGLVLIFSATAALSGGSARYMTIQTIAIILGVIGFVAASNIQYEKYMPMWRAVLLVNVLFQLSLMLFGYEDGGNRSWIRFGGIGVQPAEIGKLLFIFTFAQQINLYRYRLNQVRYLLYLGAQLLIVVAAIIIPSHDVGVALSYVFIAVIMLFAAGLSWKWFAGGAVLCCAAIPVLWQVLSNQQKNRILVLFDPTIAPDTYWQQEQSRIAIGAGRLLGQGYMQGSQTQYNMLPEKQTDFIFAVAGEEWGLIGCLLIIVLLNILIIRLFYVAYHARKQFLSLICVGVGAMFLYQTYENIFMCLGIGPVMGLTLPFFSYGGTSIVTMFLAVGMAAGISMRSKQAQQIRLAGGVVEEETPYVVHETATNRAHMVRRRGLTHTDAEAQSPEDRLMEEMNHPKKKRIKKGILADWGALAEFSDYVKEKVLYLEPDDIMEPTNAEKEKQAADAEAAEEPADSEENTENKEK